MIAPGLLVGLVLLGALARAQNSAPDQIQINAPFLTTPEKVVSAMLRLAAVKASDVVYDLGCGDGRIVIAAAKEFGAHGVGVDLNPELVQQARANARRAGVESLVRFEVNDLFDTDIRGATVVALYLLGDVNLRLRPKLLRDLKPGARVLSHSFHMREWKHDREEVVEGSHIYLWTIPGK